MDGDLVTALTELVNTAVHGAPGCIAAGVSLRHDGLISTVGASGDVARGVDDAQYREGDGPCLEALRRSRVVEIHDMATDGRWPAVAHDALALGVRSSLSTPLHESETVVGALNMYGDRPDAFDDASRAVGHVLAQQAGVLLHYLGQLQHERSDRQSEHRIAETLQRSLLPAVPDLPGLTAAARYLPSSDTAQVGGDWYDLFALPDGAVGVAVGDVMGHDIGAAASMGQLRSVLRSYAFEGTGPVGVLDRMDRLVQGFDMAQLATAFYGRLTQSGTGAQMVFGNAGHHWPLVVRPDGTADFVSGSTSRLIGAPLLRSSGRSEAAVDLPAGSTIMLFTDGLVEDRHRELDIGLQQLRGVARAHHRSGPDSLCDEVLDAMTGPNQHDDIALLALQIS